METHLRTELVLAALDMALARRRPDRVIHHSDHGSQYTAVASGQRSLLGFLHNIRRDSRILTRARHVAFYRAARLAERLPLSRSEAAALVEAVSGAHLEAAGAAEVADRIRGATAGNPFMIVETVRAIEQRAWLPDDGPPVANQVRALIGARPERLSERGRQLARARHRDRSPALVRAAGASVRRRRGGDGGRRRGAHPAPRAPPRRRAVRAGPRPSARVRVRATLAHPAKTAASPRGEGAGGASRLRQRSPDPHVRGKFATYRGGFSSILAAVC